MSMSVGGSRGEGVITQSVQSGVQRAEQVVQEMINDVKNDPAKTLRELQQPSGLSTFLDIRI
ncbi:hypothetical protein [Cohnella silvisoli]|uniref:Motility protein n=1 Tax=Cohnella silvisoli TaxID=2873699 RepID=A0ABV1KS67_9BACL|nr:hypothetical protein [Cohnella silvisoli]MCD9022526.1 hypothetical protein [Cohnella silvisoli]